MNLDALFMTLDILWRSFAIVAVLFFMGVFFWALFTSFIGVGKGKK